MSLLCACAALARSAFHASGGAASNCCVPQLRAAARAAFTAASTIGPAVPASGSARRAGGGAGCASTTIQLSPARVTPAAA